jgi:hypothetical protein
MILARRWNLIAVAIALVTGLGAALLPLGMSSTADSNGVETSTRVSLLANEGPSVLIVVAVPVLLVGLPLLLRGARTSYRARVVVVTLLGLLVVLGMMSIGLFFVPTMIAMMVSTSAQTSTRPKPLATASRPQSQT